MRAREDIFRIVANSGPVIWPQSGGRSSVMVGNVSGMSEYTIRPLDTETWEAFAQLLDKHKGAGFGCWCTWFHPRRQDLGIEVEPGRPYKEFLVREGKAHAALVFEGAAAVGWCQFGPPAELPNINHKKDYEAGLVALPDYRITCFFVDRNHRHEGVAAAASTARLA
jgi:hypothetical protein